MKKLLSAVLVLLILTLTSCTKKTAVTTPADNTPKVAAKDEYDPKIDDLDYAAQRGDNIMIKELLYNNPKLINATSRKEPNLGFAPIHMAAADNKVGTIRLLLAQGAEIDLPDGKAKRTALHYAADKGHNETVKLLLESKADPNAKDSLGLVPLHLAAFNGHTDTIEILIENKADVNAVDEKGQTPLHWSAFRGRIKAAQVLLDNKADINKLSSMSSSPLDIALSVKEKKYADFLKEKGAVKAEILKVEQIKKAAQEKNKKIVEELKRLGEKDKKGELTPEDLKAMKELINNKPLKDTGNKGNDNNGKKK